MAGGGGRNGRDADDGKENNISRTHCELQSSWSFLCGAECTAESITTDLVDAIFAFLPGGDGFSQSGSASQETTQNLALKCFTKVVHLVHSTHLQQCEIDLPTLLKKFLGLLKARDENTTQELELYIAKSVSLLGVIPQLFKCRDAAVLQAVFVGIGSFEDIFSVLDLQVPAPPAQLDALCLACVQSFAVMTSASSAAKEVFKASVGYQKLCARLSNIQQPSDALIATLCDWVVEGTHSSGDSVINNVDAFLMILDWLPTLSVKHKRTVTDSLRQLCTASTHNAMLCCSAGVFSRITRMMDAEHQNIDPTWAALLVGILEALGSHTVSSSELKQMIALFRPQQDGTQIKYGGKLLRALVKMTSKGNRRRAKHYFNLQHPSAGISVPGLNKWPGTGFTFHAWLCLDSALSSDVSQKDFSRISVFRRQLYSLFTTGGSGLEAFLSGDERLVIGACNRKDFVTVTVPDLRLFDGKWHSLAVVHCPSRRLFGQSSLSVYVDGKVRYSGPMRMPSMSEELASCYIGCGSTQAFSPSQKSPTNFSTKVKFPFSARKTGPHVSPHAPENESCIPAGAQDEVWGVPTSLQGQLGPVCLFTEGLQGGHIQALHNSGPNDLNLFQPSDVDGISRPTLPELTSKLILYYNAKAGQEHMCTDLVQPQPDRGILNGRLTGHRCHTQDLKDVLPGLGGLRVFLPLLEQIRKQAGWVGGEEGKTPSGNGAVSDKTELPAPSHSPGLAYRTEDPATNSGLEVMKCEDPSLALRMVTSTVARSQNSDKTTEEAKRDAEHEKNADGMEAERSEYPNRGRTEDRMSDEFTGVKSPYVGAGEEGLVAISGEENTSMEAEKENPDVVSGGESPDVSRSMGDTNSDKSSGGVRSAVQEGRGNVTNRPKEAWADTNAQLPKRIGEEGALVLAQGHAERQKFPIMSGEASAECKANQDTDDWIVVENQFASLDRNLHQLCQSQTTSDVALFLHLLVNILKDEHPVADELDETLRLVGYVLERTNAQCIDVAVVRAVQAMAEYVASSAAQASVHEHLLLNFALWSCSSCDVRISHVQYLSTLIKDRPAHFRADFGVKFFLDVVRLYYDGSAAGLHDHGRAGCVELTEGEVKSIRGSLLGLVKFYLTEEVRSEEAQHVVQYIVGLRDSQRVAEILDVLLSLCKRASRSRMVERLAEPDHLPVLVSLLVSEKEEKVQLKILKLMTNILTSQRVPSRNKELWRLADIGFGNVTERLTGEGSAAFVEALLYLSAIDAPEGKGIEAYIHYDIVLAVVEKTVDRGLDVRLFVSQMILRSIDASHSSLKRCAQERGWHHTLLQLITRRTRDQLDDVTDLVDDLVDTVLEIVFRVIWRGIPGYDGEAWKGRGQAMAALSTLASGASFLRPARGLERALLERCVHQAVEDIRRAEQSGAAETSNALMVLRLVEDFLFTPDAISGTGPDQDPNSWSVKLVNAVDELLEALNVWDLGEDNCEWVEMAQLGLRVFLGCISHPESEFSATASAKLSKILKSRVSSSQGEVCYILGRLYKAYRDASETGDCQNNTFIVPVMRLVLLKYQEQLPLAIYVPSFGRASLDEEFAQLTASDEFQAFIKQQIYPGMKQYQASFAESSVTSGRFWMECLTALNTNLREKDANKAAGRDSFFNRVQRPFKQLQDEQASYTEILRQETDLRGAHVGKAWHFLKRKLRSERSTWESRIPEATHWKLCMNENFQRMRLRLIQNYSFDVHADASEARDHHNNNGSFRGGDVPVSVAKEALVQNAGDDRLDEDDLIGGMTMPPSPKQRSRAMSDGAEKQVLLVDCELITLMALLPGRLELTTTHVYFFAKNGEAETAGQDFLWALTELREVHLRRYNLRRSALEFFLVDQRNYFINFDKEVRNRVYKKIMSLKPPHLYYSGARSPAQQLKTSGLTEKWVRREISNFQYLMQLNTIAGRTYNDLSQYPVFPWILVDYSSPELDLNNPDVYRDLSKPVGALNPAIAETVRKKFDNFVDPSGLIAKFHYGTHYSSSAGVLHYLIRVEPFTSLHIDLQSGRFDCADRQFHDLPALWDSLYHKGTDTKELIPEFFYFPEFLENQNRFDLGRLQNGPLVDHVVLPPWASSSEDFIVKHRRALESEHVSKNLHNWIDLIFGCKQKGPAAAEALNVFYYCTYEGAVDLDAITDPNEREATEGMINNFGQTPAQLLTHPHPQRMSAQQTAEAVVGPTTGTRRHLRSIFDAVDRLKVYFVPVSAGNEPLVFVAGSMMQAWSLIHHGMPETLLSVSQSGALGVHDWLPFSKTKSRPFTFELDPSVRVAKLRRSVTGPFDPNIPICPRLFAVTHDAKLIITAGHWDNSFRVFNLKAKLLCRMVAHADVITCLSLDADGLHLITGSRDTTCRLWSVRQQSGQSLGLCTSPLQTLCGHDREVTCVAIKWEMDLAVSGSKDGTCILYAARRGECVRTLRPPGPEPGSNPDSRHVINMVVSDFGDVVFFCKNGESRLLCRHSVNGKPLTCDSGLKNDITDFAVAGELLVTVDSRGRLLFRCLNTFKELRKINLKVRARCVCLARDNTHIFVGLDDGKLIIIAVAGN